MVMWLECYFLTYKAFANVDHSILLMDLEASGLGNGIPFLFKSYLSDRKAQF